VFVGCDWVCCLLAATPSKEQGESKGKAKALTWILPN